MIVGLSGFARSGKDTFAERLVEKHGFIRLAFADTLRDFLYALNPIVDMNRRYEADVPDGPPIYLQEVIDHYTWDHYKESHFGPEIRRLLQRLGTEAGRQTLWDTIWIDAKLKDLDEHKNYVITDARFLNEFDAIREAAARQDHVCAIVRINRPGVEAANTHASELEALQYDQWDKIVTNGGTKEDLWAEADEVASWNREEA
jgi:hypothetical protein